MIENTPKVQVLLSTYNGEKYVVQQLDSLKNQDYPNIKVKIRDDGSTDSTPRLLSEYIMDNKLDWELHVCKNIGVVKSFLWLLFSVSEKSDFYSFCDQDDYWLKDKISRAVSILSSEQKEIPLLYCSDVQSVDDNLNPIEKKFNFSALAPSFKGSLFANIVVGCTSVINEKTRELLMSKPLPNCVMHDWWIYMLTSALGKVVLDTDKTMKYRLHGQNICGAKQSFGNRIKNIFNLIVGKRYLKHQDEISKQVESFVDLYGKELSADCLKSIEIFFNRTIANRIRLFLDKNFWTQSTGSRATRINFLFNRM